MLVSTTVLACDRLCSCSRLVTVPSLYEVPTPYPLPGSCLPREGYIDSAMCLALGNGM